jgi:UPF0755 protein
VYEYVGAPAFQKLLLVPESVRAFTIVQDKPDNVSLEGYLAPETFRVFADATIPDILAKFVEERDEQIASLQEAVKKSGHTVHEILTMASVLEDEARSVEDKKIVADIMWRRVGQNWALQVDSSVHYIVDRSGDVFTTGKERDVDSLWNTYKYPGLPPGPISNPSVASIEATVNPTPNTYWYFLSGKDGKMYYARTLDEHNANKKYL